MWSINKTFLHPLFFKNIFELNKGNLDFDILSANSTVVSRTLTIFNHGTKSGSFRLKYLGQEIKFSQLLGKIKPGKSTAISAEIVTDKPKIVEELVEIYLSGEKNSVKIPISANVVTRQLAILDNSNHPINVADFGNIYVQECFKEVKSYRNIKCRVDQRPCHRQNFLARTQTG